MEIEVLSLAVLCGLALFAAIGGSISHLKNRNPMQGFMLGALLGPVGLVMVARQPFGHRPMIDHGAWHSFRSLVDYQSDPDLPLLQLPAPGASTHDRH